MPKLCNLYIDFDGTVVDVSERYYRIYCDILGDGPIEPLTKTEYWRLKSAKCTEDSAHEEQRLSMIESSIYLKYDKLIDGAVDTLERFERTNRLVLTTQRQLSIPLYKELEELGIISLFDKIYLNGQKADWIRADMEKYNNPALVVGDTEVDIRAGKVLGLATVAVTSGIRSKYLLLAENPDYLIGSIIELPSVVRKWRAKYENTVC